MKKEIRVIKNYTIGNVLSSKKCLFIFGDNERGIGKGGQAIIRDCNNSFGIPTKASPSEYWTDETYEKNCYIIYNRVEKLKTLHNPQKYNTLVFPYYGLGTGLANMPRKCPRTFLYLCYSLLDNFGFNNIESYKTN